MPNDLNPSLPPEVFAYLIANGFENNPCLPGYLQFMKTDEAVTFTADKMTVKMRWDADDDRGEHWSDQFTITMHLPWWALQWTADEYKMLFHLSGVISFPKPLKIAL